MVELIPDLPDHVLGFRAHGRVTAQDYESVIVPAVEEALSQSRKARILYQLDEDFERFEAGALWDDTKLGLSHPTGWEKIAVVTDVDWLAGTVRFFGHAIPGELRVFGNAELEEARRWVVA